MLGAWMRWPIQPPISHPTIASTIALSRLKPISRCQAVRWWVLTATNSSTSVLGVRDVRLRVGRQQLRRRHKLPLLLRDPRGELRRWHDLPGVEHVAVPDAAELGAVDGERQRLLGLDVGDVVDAGIGVGLDPELVGPERMDHVE